MSKDFRCECGHQMIGQHDRAGCLVGRNEPIGCPCMVQSLLESDGAEAQRGVAEAAMAQMQAFRDAGFTRDEGFALTKDVLLLTGQV